MLEFKKLCDAFEDLSTVEKGLILTEKSAIITAKLHHLAIPGLDPLSTLAGFIIGSVVADGRINEQEYLLIYPALVHAFGDDVYLTFVKDTFRLSGDGRDMVTKYTEDMIQVLSFLDDGLREDVITLCLCVVAIDGKVSLREKKYIRQLLEA